MTLGEVIKQACSEQNPTLAGKASDVMRFRLGTAGASKGRRNPDPRTQGGLMKAKRKPLPVLALTEEQVDRILAKWRKEANAR